MFRQLQSSVLANSLPANRGPYELVSLHISNDYLGVIVRTTNDNVPVGMRNMITLINLRSMTLEVAHVAPEDHAKSIRAVDEEVLYIYTGDEISIYGRRFETLKLRKPGHVLSWATKRGAIYISYDDDPFNIIMNERVTLPTPKLDNPNNEVFIAIDKKQHLMMFTRSPSEDNKVRLYEYNELNKEWSMSIVLPFAAALRLSRHNFSVVEDNLFVYQHTVTGKWHFATRDEDIAPIYGANFPDAGTPVSVAGGGNGYVIFVDERTFTLSVSQHEWTRSLLLGELTDVVYQLPEKVRNPTDLVLTPAEQLVISASHPNEDRVYWAYFSPVQTTTSGKQLRKFFVRNMVIFAGPRFYRKTPVTLLHNRSSIQWLVNRRGCQIAGAFGDTSILWVNENTGALTRGKFTLANVPPIHAFMFLPDTQLAVVQGMDNAVHMLEAGDDDVLLLREILPSRTFEHLPRYNVRMAVLGSRYLVVMMQREDWSYGVLRCFTLDGRPLRDWFIPPQPDFLFIRGGRRLLYVVMRDHIDVIDIWGILDMRENAIGPAPGFDESQAMD